MVTVLTDLAAAILKLLSPPFPSRLTIIIIHNPLL